MDGDRAYLGYGDAGMVVLDISDRGKPTQVGHLNWEPGGDTHNLASGDRITMTQSAIVLENLISQFLFSKAAEGKEEQK